MWRSCVQRVSIALALVALLAVTAPSPAESATEHIGFVAWLSSDLGYYPYGDPSGEPLAAASEPTPDSGYYPYGDPSGKPLAAASGADSGYYPYGNPSGEPLAAASEPILDSGSYPFGDPSG
jgi:hypothetical protein